LTVAAPLVLLTIALAAVPWLFDDFFAYQLGLYLLYGMVAQGIALTWGRAGFLSLGQALFFGLGAYLSGFILKASQQGVAWLALLPLGALLPALLAYLIGRLVFARRHESGPFFSLITLALVMLGFQFANQWSSVTGGFNGLSGIPELPGLDRYSTLYWLIAALSVLVTGFFVWLNRTPLGTLWLAIAQNEDRLQFFGFATHRLKALAFAISAFAAGLAGVLYAPQQGLVTPQATGFLLAAEFVIWTAVGGRASPYGALLGAVVIGLLSSELRERIIYWEAIVALVFIVVVLRYPGGLLAALGEVGRVLVRLTRALGLRAAGAHGDAAEPAPTGAPALHTAAAQPATLAFEDVRVRLNQVDILDGLDLRIAGAGLHCIIGPNGAGKTSSFNAITGRLPLSSGAIRFMGRDVSGQQAVAVTRLGIGRKFQIPSVFPQLSVADNLRIAVWAHRSGWRALLSRRSRQWRTPLWRLLEAEFPFLAEQARRPAGELSQGQRQMLELAMTLLPEPRLLLLDEPCAGLSPAETRRQIEVIVKAVDNLRATALVIEHDMSAVEAMANRVHVLHQGRLLASGTLAEVQADPAVQAVYAGGRK
jgi:branched-chain amino acid transport system permease protein